MQNPERREDVSVPLLEEQRYPVATDQGHPVPALGDGHVALLRQDVLKVGLGAAGGGGGGGGSAVGWNDGVEAGLRC